MARPRIFVSSTYFDLKSVRADLEHFIREKGYDSVLHERSNIPYGKQEALERYCYKEIENCDIVISVVGGRFGSTSADSSYSVSQTELRVALELSKQVYVFVESDVYHEYRTYEQNKDREVQWTTVDDVKIFQFLDEVYKLKNNNPVFFFETSIDIIGNLKEQWAGLFQRLLAQSTSDALGNMFIELKHSLETARSLTEVISAQAEQKDEIVADLILTNHPAFIAIKNAMNVPYRILFYDLAELEKWIEARGYSRDPFEDNDLYEWFHHDKSGNYTSTTKINRAIFDDDGKLRPIQASEWQDDWVSHTKVRVKKRQPATFDTDLDDDVPF